MTDWYIDGYKITLVTLRGGAKVIVVRDSMNLRYIRQFTDLGEFDRWIATFLKEIDYGKAECNQED